MKTATKILFSFMDVTAKQDATYAGSLFQEFSNLEQLREAQPLPLKNYATLEADSFLLDGSKEMFANYPKAEAIGVWGTCLSDGVGNLTNPPVITISFSQVHSSNGLTLRFWEYGKDFCSKVHIAWYDGADNLLYAQTYFPNTWEYFAQGKVLNYQKVVITLQATNLPYHYPKLTGVDFGSKIYWDEFNLLQGTMRESLDPTCGTITVNRLNLHLYSDDANFNLYDPQGAYELLQARQELEVSRFVDGALVDKSTYYLANWEETAETPSIIEAYDLVGFLDAVTFKGDVYVEVTVENLVNQIMTTAGLPYVLDNGLKGQTLSGWLPTTNCREALRNVAYALGAVVDCSRGNAIAIYLPKNQGAKTIIRDRQGRGASIKQLPQITGVEVMSYSFVVNTQEWNRVYSQTLPVGVREISFSKPYANLNIVIGDGEILASSANHCKLKVNTAGEFVLQANPYMENAEVVQVGLTEILPGNKENVLKPKNCTLLNSTRALAVANRLFAYYNNRYETKVDLLLNEERVGQKLTLLNQQPRQLTAQVEELEIDLLAGFLTKAKLRGSLG